MNLCAACNLSKLGHNFGYFNIATRKLLCLRCGKKTEQYHENHWKNIEATFYALTIIAGNSCFTQFSTRFYGNRSFAASHLFLMLNSIHCIVT